MAEPLQRRTADDGGKFYEHPSRTEDVPQPAGAVLVRPRRYVSVTTALGVVNKDALKFWSANLAARRAMENIPALIGAARIDDCGRARARTDPPPCKVCAACIEAWIALFHVGETERRAREGSAAHDVFELWIKVGEWRYVPNPEWGEWAPTAEQMAPYIQRLQEFIADYGLTPESFLAAECTVWNHTFGYAGTLDGIVIIRPVTKKAAELCARINLPLGLPLDSPVTVLVDLKSREGEDAAIYPEYVLQLTGYRFAETMTPKHAAAEMERPMIQTDAAVVLQVRPDGYTFRPVLADGNAMKAFRAVLDLSGWSSTVGDYSTQVQAFPKPDGWKAPTWERATDPTGTLCGCPYCDDPDDSRCQFAKEPRPLGKHTKTVRAPKTAAAPRKRTPRAAPGAKPAPVATSATVESMVDRQRFAGSEIDPSTIPF